MESQEVFEARLAEGHEFAPSLLGLDCDDAIERATERGFLVQVIPPTAEAITADLRANRIRIFLDDDGVVARARAG
jgi:hypothetical protein